MRIRRVNAIAFGALHDKTLNLADGLTIIHGRNESGKSTWHAALYAALCGHPRSGDRSEADLRFEQLRRPRHLQGWAVEAEVEFDGQTIRIRQELLDPLRSTVSPSDEEARMRQGELLEVCRLLNLDRRSFAATAWVEQGHSQDVLTTDRSDHNELERAVAECVDDDAARDAIARIDTAKAIVGTDGQADHRLAQAVAAADHRRQDRDAVAALTQARDDAATQLDTRRRDARRALEALRYAELVAARAQERELYDESGRLRQSQFTTSPLFDSNTELFGRHDHDADPSVVDAEQNLYAAEQSLHEAEQRQLEASEDEDTRPMVSATPESDLFAKYGRPEPFLVSGGAPPVEREPVVSVDPPQPVVSEPLADPSTRWNSAQLGSGIALILVGIGLAVILRSYLFGALAVAGLGMASFGVAQRQRARRPDSAELPIEWPTPVSSVPGSDPPYVEAVTYSPQPVSPAPLAEIPVEVTRTDPRAEIAVAAARLRVGEAREDLARALSLRGQPASAEGVYAALDEYRAAYVQRRQARDEQLRQRALIEDRMAEVAEEIAEVEQRIRQLNNEVDPYALRSTGSDNLEAARLTYDTTTDAVAVAVETSNQAMGDVASAMSVEDAEAALRVAADELRLLRDLVRALDEARGSLARARDAARQQIARAIETSLDASLPEVTGRQYSSIVVTDDFHVNITESADSADAAHHSYGMAEQAYLLARIMLGWHLAGDGVRGPLLLDDVTSHADPIRARGILDALLRIAQRRQVVVFAHDQTTVDWAHERIVSADGAVHAIELTSVDSDPQGCTPPAS